MEEVFGKRNVAALLPGRYTTCPAITRQCTRSLLGWRLVPKGTKGVDAGLVIADAMMPEPMRPG